MTSRAAAECELSEAGGTEMCTKDGPRVMNLVNVAVFASVPFLLALDIATTSTACDQLMDTLNDQRIKYGVAVDERISWLEKCLANMNRGQGRLTKNETSSPADQN